MSEFGDIPSQTPESVAVAFCPGCGAERVTDAEFCHKCGRSLSFASAAAKFSPPTLPVREVKKSSSWGCLAVILLSLILLAFGVALLGVALLSDPSGSRRTSASGPRYNSDGSLNISTGKYFGCRQQSTYIGILRLHDRGDSEAFLNALTGGMVAGSCIELKPGTRVFPGDTDGQSGLINVRPAGDTLGYWTGSEAVR